MMNIVLGATGRVGSAVARTLLQQGEPVTIITRQPDKAQAWARQGATVAVADVFDTQRLRAVFRTGQRLFLLNPPAAPNLDTDQEERRSVASLLEALSGLNLRKVVALSTYGAQPGHRIGDLGVLYELERGLVETGIPAATIRAAYFMSNWDLALATARQEGRVYTFFPPDLSVPMVSPQDLGEQAASLLRAPVEESGLFYVEGPRAYSSREVAAAFAQALAEPVEAVEIPRNQWVSSLQAVGFSAAAAGSMAAMTARVVDQRFDLPVSPRRGTTTLEGYVNGLVQRKY